jgi:predicted PurR-regulated permease PerM
VSPLFLLEFMGVIGAVVAVPVAAAAQVVVAEIVTIRRERAHRHAPTGTTG